jgi:predicted transcriptional regulator
MKNYMQRTLEKDRSRELKTASVKDYMARDLITFSPETEIGSVIETLLKHKISGAPVLNSNGEIVGVIDDKDCINTLIDSAYYNQPVSRGKVSSYMTNVFKRINVNADIADVANMFIRSNFKRLLVVDDHGKLQGSISRRDVLRAIKEMETTSWR